jgi:hypothetical protein
VVASAAEAVAVDMVVVRTNSAVAPGKAKLRETNQVLFWTQDEGGVVVMASAILARQQQY